MKITKPTRDEYLELRFLYSKQSVVTELDLKDKMSDEKIAWLKKHNYIKHLNELSKCMSCDMPVLNGCKSCCGYHRKLWDRCNAAKSTTQQVKAYSQEEYEYVLNINNKINKLYNIKMNTIKRFIINEMV